MFQLLWGVYILTAMILFLNMLIAMLTETYVNTINNAETEWKYARSVVVTKYTGTHPFLFPFNLILYPLFLVYHVTEQRLRRTGVKETTDDDEEAVRQSSFLHKTLQKRFKDKFKDVLDIPYHYRINIFNFYTTFPFQQKLRQKKGSTKRRKSKGKTLSRKTDDSSSSDNKPLDIESDSDQ